MSPRPRKPFTAAASRKSPKRRRDFPTAYDDFIAEFNSFTRGVEDLNDVEPQFRQSFTKFLDTCGFAFCKKNFEALLKESSGDKFYRNDGSVSWYHQVVPIIMMMSTIRKGSSRNGVDTKYIQEHGGMEVLIAGHLRHDSVEDFLDDKIELLEAQFNDMLQEIKDSGDNRYAANGQSMVSQTITNVDLMSQRKLKDENGNVLLNEKGKPIKENVFSYISRLVYSAAANPIAFIQKQADIIYNFATMFGAPKFMEDLDRMAKRLNEKENMYGSRQSFFTDALKKWKPFAKVIRIFDGNMGEPLYKMFRYLENVELYYKHVPEAFRREPNDFPVTTEFLRDAMRLDLPELIHPLHVFLKRMQKSVDQETDPEKYARLQNFLEKVIKPSLEDNKESFPYLFQTANDNMQFAKQAAPASPVAFG